MGQAEWSVRINSNASQVLSDVESLKSQLNTLNTQEYDIQLNIDKADLNKAIKNLGKSIKTETGKTKLVIDTSSLTQSLTGIESHLKTIKEGFAGIGDESGLSSTISTIGKIEDSINSLSKNIGNMKLNLNLDIGNQVDPKIEQQISKAKQRYLQSYKDLFSSIRKSGKTTNDILNFYIPDDMSVDEQIGAYQDVIDRARKQFTRTSKNGKRVDLYKTVFGDEYREIDNARSSLNYYLKKRNDGSNIKDLLGLDNTSDLSNVEASLNTITESLNRVATAAESVKTAFDNGLDMSSTIEQIEQLKNKVKELEAEKAKANISDDNVSKKDTFQNDSSGKSSYSIDNEDEELRAIKRTERPTKKGEVVTENKRYGSGESVTSVNGKTREISDTFDLDKNYKELNKDVQSYYGLLIKQKKDGSLSDVDKVKLDVLKNQIDARKEDIELAKEQYGLSSKEAEQNAKRLESAWKSDLEKTKPKESKTPVTDKTIEKEADRQQKAAEKEAGKQQKELNQKLRAARDFVNDESFVKIQSDIDKRLNNYIGQEDDSSSGKRYIEDARTAKDMVLEANEALNSALKSGDQNDIALAYDNLTSSLENFNSAMSKVESTMKKSVSSSTLDDMKNQVEKFKKDYADFLSEDTLRELNEKVENQLSTGTTDVKPFTTYFENLKQETKQAKNLVDSINDEQYKIDTGYYDSTRTKMRYDLDSYRGQDSEKLSRATEAYNSYTKAVDEFTQKMNDNEIKSSEDLKSHLDEINKQYDTYKNLMNSIKKESSKTLEAGVAQKASNDVQRYINNNSKAWKKYKTQLEEVRDAYKTVTTEAEKADIDAKFKNIKSMISAEGLTGRNAFSEIARGFKQIGQFAATYGILQNLAYDLPNKMVEAVKDINSAQIELRKVSDAPNTQLDQYWSQAADSAKKYGATISDVISSTADWSKLGYNLDDSKKLSDVTTLYQRVGDNMTQETASQSLVSTLQGFNMQADEAESIVDKFNEVANNYAIGSDGIGEALQRSAASFNAAHTDLSKSIALITGTNTTLQDPDKVGCTYIADLYRNVMIIKVAISVNVQRWIRPSKDSYTFSYVN